MTEHLLQAECICVFRNEIERYGKGVIIPVLNELAAKRKDIIVCLGASDLITITDVVRFNELKVGYNSQSAVQIKFEKLVTSLGYEYNVVRSIEQFKKIHNIP